MSLVALRDTADKPPGSDERRRHTCAIPEYDGPTPIDVVKKYDPADEDPVVGRVAREVVTTTVTITKMQIDDLPLHRSGVACEA